MTKKKINKIFIINSSIIFLSIAFSVILFEILIRFTPYYSLTNIYPALNGFFKEDKTLGYVGVPSHRPTYMKFSEGSYILQTDSFGNFSEEPTPGSPYFLCAGDSFLWGHGKKGKKFCDLIGSSLGLETINISLPGYGPMQYTSRAINFINQYGYSPNLTVLGFYIGNDFEDDYLFPSGSVTQGYWHSTKVWIDPIKGIYRNRTEKEINELLDKTVRKIGNPDFIRYFYRLTRNWLLDNSVIFNIIERLDFKNKKIKLSSQKDSTNTLPCYMRVGLCDWFELQFDKTVQLIIDTYQNLNENGSDVIVIIIPSKQSIYVSEYFKSADPKLIESRFSYKDNLINILKTNGVDYIDLTKIFLGENSYREKIFQKEDKQQVFWLNDGHWNHAGQKKAANEVLSKYKEMN